MNIGTQPSSAGVIRRDLNPVNIRTVTSEDRGEWVRMREALWPGSRADHERETETWFVESRPDWATFVLERPGDTQPENERSYHVHLALGYMDVGRIICFRKRL